GGAAMGETDTYVAVGCYMVVPVGAVDEASPVAGAKVEAAGGVIAASARAQVAAEDENRLLAELWAHNEHLDRLLASLRAPIDPRDAELWAHKVLAPGSDEWIIREVSK